MAIAIHYFGFLCLNALEGETPFNFLTGAFLIGAFLTIPFLTGNFLTAVFFTGNFFANFAGTFFTTTFTFFFGATGFTGFRGILAADFPGIGFFVGFFTGLTGVFFDRGLGAGFAGFDFAIGAGVALAGTLGLPTGIALEDSVLGSGSGVATVGDGGVGDEGEVKMGETQLRLTASESILLNSDNNSGSSGTS